MRATTPPEEPMLTVQELAELLRVSPTYVLRRVRIDEWPHLEQPWKGRVRYLFRPEDRDLIVASMDPSPVVSLRRRRRPPAPAPAPARKRRSS